MSQSSAILTLHRRTGGDTEGGRAIARRKPRARGASRLLRRKQGVTARASRPGPASKLPSLGRRGLAETLRVPRGGGGGACLFLKSGVRAGGWSLGGDRRRRPAAEKGQPMRELGPERGKWGCQAGGRGLHAARRRARFGGGHGQGTPGCARAEAAAGRAGCRSAGAARSAGAGRRQLLRPGRRGKRARVHASAAPPRAPPRPAPPGPAEACAAQTRGVCAATQFARGPRPPGRGPGRKTLPSRRAHGGGRGRLRNTAAPLPERNVVSYGTRLHDLAEFREAGGGVGVARELRELGARAFPLAPESGRGNCARARSFGNRGGGEPELVQQRPKLERCRLAERPHPGPAGAPRTCYPAVAPARPAPLGPAEPSRCLTWWWCV